MAVAMRTERMTDVAIETGVAAVTGIAEAVVIRMGVGSAAQSFVQWATLLGAPVIGLAGSFLSKGLMASAFEGMAAGGAGILGYYMVNTYYPAGGRAGARLPGMSVKQLQAGGPGLHRSYQPEFEKAGAF